VHRRLAEVVTDAEERGRHLGGAVTAPDAEVAAALDDAAAAARARGAPAAAADLAEVAVRLTPAPDEASLLRRLRAAADHQFAAGSTARARALLEQALASAPRGLGRARIAVQLALQLDSQDLAAERLLLAQALREAEGDPRLRAKIHDRLSIYFQAGDGREARRHAHIAFGLAERVGDPALVAMTLARAFQADFWCGQGVDHALIGRGIALEERLPRLALARRPSHSYAFALTWAGDVERARLLFERLRALGRAEADLGVVNVMVFSAYHELVAEDWEQAARQTDEAWMLAVEAERDVEIAMCLWSRAYVAAYRGQVEQVRSDASEAHRIAAAVGFPDHVLLGVTLGILDLSLSEPSSALAHLRPSRRAARTRKSRRRSR
jgi:hypothetical protein